MDNFVPISLPSKCMTYGVPVDSIRIGTFLGKHEKQISEISEDNFDTKLVEILSDVVKGISVEKLTLGDRLYILIWEAINSYTDKYPFTSVCEGCGQRIEIIANLSELESKELPDDYKEPYEIELSTGRKIELRLFTAEDEVVISKYEQQSSDSSFLYRFALSIVSDAMDIMQKVQFLSALPARDVALIRAFHDKYQHGPILEWQYECKACGSAGVAPIPFRVDLFFPYGKQLTTGFGNLV